MKTPRSAAAVAPRVALPRWRSLQILERVFMDGASLTPLLVERTADLSPRDAAWTRALAYSTVRWWGRLDAGVDLLLHHPLPPRDRIVRVVLCQGLAELFHFGTADHAAVQETAELARMVRRPGAVGLVNALLRRALRERLTWMAALDQDASSRFSCPHWLQEAILARDPDPAVAEVMLHASLEPAPMTLRCHLARASRPLLRQRLQEQGFSAWEHPWVPTALVLETPAEVTALPGFAEGALSVQDAAAQWAALLLNPRPGERVLDACAAPGGKTGHLLECVGGDLRLTALDIDATRLQRVEENLRRLGFTATLRQGDLLTAPVGWEEPLQDAILLDVPCSGTGVIRRHPDIKWLRHAADIPVLAQRQAALLERAWSLLRPGGRLLYSTCSLLGAENESVVSAWLARTPQAREIPLDFPGGTARSVGRSIALGAATMDGFYYALLEKSP